MTLQALDTQAVWPSWPFTGTVEPTVFRSRLMDAANEYIAFVVRVQKTGNIRNVGFRTGTVTTGGTSDLDIRIETIDAAGDPSGALWAANTNINHDVADTDDNVFHVTNNLTASAAVVRGNIIVVKILNPASGFGNMNISLMEEQMNRFPYSVESIGAGAVHQSWAPVLGLQYDDGIYYPIVGAWPFSAESRGLSATPEEDGIKFRQSVPRKVDYAEVFIEGDNDWDLVLRSDGTPGTELTRQASDKDYQSSIGTSGRHIVYFDDEVELSADTWYRLLVDRNGAAVGVHYFSTLNSAIMNATPGGNNVIRTSWNGSTWDDVDTELPLMSLGHTEFDDGAGGGGLLVHPGTSGGARG
jgi:hypothetical protein